MKNVRFLSSLLLIIILISCNSHSETNRNIVSLNGTWEIAQSIDTTTPNSYTKTINVPGLMDLAEPEFDSTGVKSGLRNYFWYKRKIRIDNERTDLVYLKVHKAKFGHSVFINGKYQGEYNYCFTPGMFEISDAVNFGEENEIVIRVGASPEVLPDTIPWGEDVEKYRYYPGIYDNVELIFSNYPHIKNVQIVPNIDKRKVTVVTDLENGPTEIEFPIEYKVREKNSSKVVAEGMSSPINLDTEQKEKSKFEIDLPDYKFWSPENPFLYELVISTPGDSKTETFGMREFSFDPQTKQALLNGKPFYLRGTNIALHRFFEDSVRGKLPWDIEWINNLHDTLKEMNWNSYRFHVGSAPEMWYDIADEKGILVQDEYAIWGIFSKDTLRHMASTLIPEYEAWMKERMNHPSVVIWDAQNETVWRETGKVIDSIRHLDLSNRPWDNGFSPPQAESDPIESHPYLFSKVKEMPKEGLLKLKLGSEPEPFNDPNTRWPPKDKFKFNNPVIVNEYGWLWLYRDGTPAMVAENVWDLYPELNTPKKRWNWRGRVIAAMTEYWRSHRDVAGVQHFCILTCNRQSEPKSQVSDEWMNVENLILQPEFKKFVKPAFAPVGIMIKLWDKEFYAAQKIIIPVVLINDLYENWSGVLKLKLIQNRKIIKTQKTNGKVESLHTNQIDFDLSLPIDPGEYEIVAEIENDGEKIFSTRLIKIK